MNFTDSKQLQAFLDQRERKLEDVSNEISKISYRRFVEKTSDPRLPGLEQQRAEMMLDPAFANLVEEWLPRVEEPVLRRRLENIRAQLQLARVASQPKILELARELNDLMVGYQYPLGGERVDITGVRQTVRANPDREQRKLAWHSYGELSEKMAPKLMELIELRNAEAAKLGYDTYADLILERSELSLVESEGMLETLVTATNPVYLGVLEAGAAKLGLDKIEPWDVQFILESTSGVPDSLFPRDGILPAVRAWADSMGLDIDKLGIHMITADIPYNGLCMALGRNDIRILGNPADGYGYYKTSFHELGHALHGTMNKQEHLSLRREASVFNEAIAEVFGYVPGNERWLKERGLDHNQVQLALEAARGPQFHYLRQRTAYALFEYKLYRNTAINPDAVLGETEAWVLGCSANASPRWAANAWFLNFPVYWQNYVLADVIASQIHHDLEARFGPLHHTREAVDFVLEQYIAPGALKPWRQKLEENTGKPLAVDALVADING